MAYPTATRHGAMLLRAHGLTVREIADRIGIPYHTVGRWVRGVERVAFRECEQCGEMFVVAARGVHRFCDSRCARAHREGLQGPAPAIDRETCRLCGEDLGDGRRGRGYCCREHAAKGWRVFGRLERRPAV